MLGDQDQRVGLAAPQVFRREHRVDGVVRLRGKGGKEMELPTWGHANDQDWLGKAGARDVVRGDDCPKGAEIAKFATGPAVLKRLWCGAKWKMIQIIVLKPNLP